MKWLDQRNGEWKWEINSHKVSTCEKWKRRKGEKIGKEKWNWIFGFYESRIRNAVIQLFIISLGSVSIWCWFITFQKQAILCWQFYSLAWNKVSYGIWIGVAVKWRTGNRFCSLVSTTWNDDVDDYNTNNMCIWLHDSIRFVVCLFYLFFFLFYFQYHLFSLIYTLNNTFTVVLGNSFGNIYLRYDGRWNWFKFSETV